MTEPDEIDEIIAAVNKAWPRTKVSAPLINAIQALLTTKEAEAEIRGRIAELSHVGWGEDWYDDEAHVAMTVEERLNQLKEKGKS